MFYCIIEFICVSFAYICFCLFNIASFYNVIQFYLFQQVFTHCCWQNSLTFPVRSAIHPPLIKLFDATKQSPVRATEFRRKTLVCGIKLEFLIWKVDFCYEIWSLMKFYHVYNMWIWIVFGKDWLDRNMHSKNIQITVKYEWNVRFVLKIVCVFVHILLFFLQWTNKLQTQRSLNE